MQNFDEFINEFSKIGGNANKYKDQLANTNYTNAWRTAYVLWQDAYAVMDIAIMFRYFWSYHFLVVKMLDNSNANLEKYDEYFFLTQKQLNEAKKHLIDVLKWNHNIEQAGCDGISYVVNEVNKFVNLIDDFILFIQNLTI